ncbi:hypothetical protein YC2023_113456 [Brassica napus]
MKTIEERLTMDLQHGASKIRSDVDLRRTAQVMQLSVDPHKTCSIVGCRIFYEKKNRSRRTVKDEITQSMYAFGEQDVEERKTDESGQGKRCLQ